MRNGSDRSNTERYRLFHAAVGISAAHGARQPADAAFLDALAKRLAVAARLPLDQARRRVAMLAISAQRTAGALLFRS